MTCVSSPPAQRSGLPVSPRSETLGGYRGPEPLQCRLLGGTGISRRRDNKPPLDEPAEARWRIQALDWLKADLANWTKEAAPARLDAKALVRKTLQHWKADEDLAQRPLRGRPREALPKRNRMPGRPSRPRSRRFSSDGEVIGWEKEPGGTVSFKGSIVDDLRWFGKKNERILLDETARILAENPLAESRNMKSLRPDHVTRRELRLFGKYRVLFDVDRGITRSRDRTVRREARRKADGSRRGLGCPPWKWSRSVKPKRT